MKSVSRNMVVFVLLAVLCLLYSLAGCKGTYSADPQSGKMKTNLKDGAEMVWVPAGEFLMGSDILDSNESPQRQVFLDGYWMYKYEVTVAQYRSFCRATNRTMPSAPSWGWLATHPIVNVSWYDAVAYASWAGVALPTEAQWEKAARGTDGRVYPWGNEWDSSKSRNYEDNSMGTKPVGSYPLGVSPYGCMDMDGNAGEWCADWYSNTYYQIAPRRSPSGPSSSHSRVLRGGSWLVSYLHFVNDSRCASRGFFAPARRLNLYGFRCARTE